MVTWSKEKSRKQVVVRKGAPVPLIIGLVFIALKLTGAIDWSWVWVLSPFWICAGIWVLVLAVLGLVLVFAHILRLGGNGSRR